MDVLVSGYDRNVTMMVVTAIPGKDRFPIFNGYLKDHISITGHHHEY